MRHRFFPLFVSLVLWPTICTIYPEVPQGRHECGRRIRIIVSDPPKILPLLTLHAAALGSFSFIIHDIDGDIIAL